MAEIVKLNVGGVIYTTSRSTLTKYPNSMLGTMFSGRLPTTKDEYGNYWIDGNGDIFRYVLEFLRRGCLMVPDHFQDFEILEKEADFYQLPELIQAVNAIKCKNADTEEGPLQYLVVKTSEFNSRYPCVNIFGPTDELEKLVTSFSQYDAGEVSSNGSKIKFSGYSNYSIPLIAMKVEILNLGFSICQNMNGDIESHDLEQGKVFWFVKK
ncbi:BTB/POZ domain-containing protein KCTD21-like [Amphiura filiformis]|uniref:BTB/POZ domain-containing protein KCTD21-like n=1 Tax=Amphiura filiformis TaxID=82378 RepID=UPI003B2277F4